MSKKTFSLLLGLILITATTVSAGVVFEVETKNHKKSSSGVEKMEILVEGSNIAMPVVPPEGQGGRGKMIFLGDKGTGEVIFVDDDKKMYHVMNEASIKAIAEQMNAVMSQMDEMLKHLPKEQRDAIMKSQQGGGAGMPGAMKQPPKPEIKKTGESAKKAGYPCVKYEIYQEGRKIREMWTTDWKNIDNGKEAAAAFKDMGKFFESMVKAMPQMPGSGQNPYEEMNFGNGYPVVVTGFDGKGNKTEESLLKATRKQKIAPAAFQTPSGYQQMSMEQQ